MHFMIRYNSSKQLSISEFKMPLEAKLDENNRWVVLSKIVSWEEFARLYYKNFKSNRGAPTKDARLVLGVIIIKHIMKTDDHGVIEMIQENSYMQYFLGLEAFTYEQVMIPSLLVSIRKANRSCCLWIIDGRFDKKRVEGESRGKTRRGWQG